MVFDMIHHGIHFQIVSFRLLPSLISQLFTLLVISDLSKPVLALIPSSALENFDLVSVPVTYEFTSTVPSNDYSFCVVVFLMVLCTLVGSLITLYCVVYAVSRLFGVGNACSAMYDTGLLICYVLRIRSRPNFTSWLENDASVSQTPNLDVEAQNDCDLSLYESASDCRDASVVCCSEEH